MITLNEIIDTRRVSLSTINDSINPTHPPKKKNSLFSSIKQDKGLSIIAEFKRTSPSAKGIVSDKPLLQTVSNYEKNGACAVSVLTEPDYFHGSIDDLSAAADAVQIPLLCKDFIVHRSQIDAAKAHGASAVLLMCSVLGKEIGDFIEHCNALHIECLVETRDKKEIELAQESGAIIIGINNRNLKTMQVELTTALSLRQYIDPGKIAVAESGIRTREDLMRVKKYGFDAVLIGSAFMSDELSLIGARRISHD